jgi:hypothetical protein
MYALAAMAACFLFVASVPADASTIHPHATGGGCSSLHNLRGGTFNVCIGAASHGVARADIYVHWTGNHSGCIAVTVWDSYSNGTLVQGTEVDVPCDLSGTQHVFAGYVRNNNPSTYKGCGQVANFTGAICSPVIHLP